MNYESLRKYTKDIAEALTTTETIQFFHGRKEVIHGLPELPDGQTDDGIVVYSLLFPSNGSFTENAYQFNRAFNVNIIIYKKDEQGSEINQNNLSDASEEVLIIEQTDALAQEFIRNFNFNSITPELQKASEELEITGTSNITPFVKDNDYLLTGVGFTITVNVPDQFNYCATQNIIGLTYTNNFQTIGYARADDEDFFLDMVATLDPPNATATFTFNLDGLTIDANTGEITEGNFVDIPVGLNTAFVSAVGTGDYEGSSASFQVVLYKRPCNTLFQTEYDELTEVDPDVYYLICEV